MASRSDGESDRRLRKTSVAWNYFTLVDEEKRIASCNTCDSHMSFRSSISNLMKHLKRKHGDIETRISEEEKESDSEVDEANKINLDDEDKAQFSTVWEHFKVTSAEKKIATCSVCQVPLSYKSGVRALAKHLRSKHNIGDDAELLSDDDDKKADSPPPGFRSVIWPYFRIADTASKTARCLVCRKLLSYNTGTSNLRKHLQRKHPGIKLPAPGEERKTIILSSGDQLYEYELESAKGEANNDNEDNHDEDQNEPIALDEVFLDEFNGNINRIESKYKKKRKHRQKVVLEHSDSDEELVFRKKYVKQRYDSIDLFARYIASLLKELPKQTSKRLQKEFVQQILSAQAEGQGQYSITIAEAADSVPEDVRYEVITTKPEILTDDSDAHAQGDAWNFFERTSSGEARCAVCRALVPYDALREHLRTNHPKLIEHNSEDEAADNLQEEVYTEIVYLENEESLKKPEKNVEKARKFRKTPENIRNKRRLSSTSDEEPLRLKKTKKENEIDQFGKYITCLLKNVPQEQSMELQMEIVNLIVKKQLELKRKETSFLAGAGHKMAAVETADASCQAASLENTATVVTSLSNGYACIIENVNDESVVQAND